jgi:hypothetical protein
MEPEFHLGAYGDYRTMGNEAVIHEKVAQSETITP